MPLSSLEKLRILFINSIQMFGGGEIWMLSTMQALAKKGHHIGLICRPNTELAERTRNQNFWISTIPMRGDFDPVTIYKFYKSIKSFAPDIILTNMDKELRLAGFATRFYKKAVLIPRRGIDYPLKNHLLYKITYKNWANGILANSHSTKRSLLQNASWLGPEKIKVIYNGIDPSKFTKKSDLLRTKLKISKSDFVFGFVGQLDERKGLHDLLPAFEIVNAKHKNTKLLLAGEGVLKQEIEHFIKKQKLENSVYLLGFYDDIPEFMATINTLVLPSLWEGFGIVLIEAMACGKSVIATNTSNIPEIVNDGEAGLLVEPKNFEQLSAAMIKLISEPKQTKKMGEIGKKLVNEKFTINRMIDELEDYFYKILGQKKKSKLL